MSRSDPLRAERAAWWWHAGLRARLWLARGWHAAARTARLAIGIPDYDGYVAHVRRHHGGVEPMDRDTFFRDRMQARYGKGRSRCC